MIQKHIDQLNAPENKKCSPWIFFEKKNTLKPLNLWAGEVLDARRRGCLNITLAQKWNTVIFQISAEKSSTAWQKIFCTFLYTFGIVICNVDFLFICHTIQFKVSMSGENQGSV